MKKTSTLKHSKVQEIPLPLNYSDNNLMRKIANERDEKAFELLFNRHKQQAFSLAKRCSGSQIAAEEIFQEAMLQVWRAAKTFRSGNAKQWILRIVVNESRRIHKRSTSRKNRENVYGHSRNKEANERHIGCEAPDLSEHKTRLSLAVNRLTCADQNLARWYYELGLTQENIAKKLGVVPRTVSYRLGKLLTQLRRAMN